MDPWALMPPGYQMDPWALMPPGYQMDGPLGSDDRWVPNRLRPGALLGFLVPFASSDCHMAIQGGKYYPLKGGGVIPVPAGTLCGQDPSCT